MQRKQRTDSWSSLSLTNYLVIQATGALQFMTAYAGNTTKSTNRRHKTVELPTGMQQQQRVLPINLRPDNIISLAQFYIPKYAVETTKQLSCTE